MPTYDVYPEIDQQAGAWLDETGATSSMWAGIDEDPGSSNDADYISGPTNASHTLGSANSYIASLWDVPADFGAMTSANIFVRLQGVNIVNDTLWLDSRLVHPTGPTVYAIQASVISPGSSIVNDSRAYTLTSDGLAASAAGWNSARLELAQTWSASMGSDGTFIRVYAVRIELTYTVPAATRPKKPVRVLQAVNRAASYRRRESGLFVPGRLAVA